MKLHVLSFVVGLSCVSTAGAQPYAVVSAGRIAGVGNGSLRFPSVQPDAGLRVGYRLARQLALDLAGDFSQGQYANIGGRLIGEVRSLSAGLTYSF